MKKLITGTYGIKIGLITSLLFCITLLAGIFLINQSNYRSITVQNLNIFEEDEKETLMKENSRLRGILESIVPKELKKLYEDNGRNISEKPVSKVKSGNTKFADESVSPHEALIEGAAVDFKVLMKDTSYKRPLYDPDWKGFYFRGWLRLPQKNIEARHRLFVFPLGASSNFDFAGSLGLDEVPSINSHRNVNLLVYGSNVAEVKKYRGQVILSGKTSRTGIQVISVIQDSLLAPGEDKKNLLFQLSTPSGFEVDYLYNEVYRYSTLIRKPDSAVKHEEYKSDDLEKLMDENNSAKKLLYYFVPYQDKIFRQDNFKLYPPELPYDVPDIKLARLNGKHISYKPMLGDENYRRPVFDPLWYNDFRNRWCFVPRQMSINMSRLFIIPGDVQGRYNLMGLLGNTEVLPAIKQALGYPSSGTASIDLLIYQCKVTDVIRSNNRLLVIGEPSRYGFQIIHLPGDLPESDYIISLVTPDGCELDFETVLVQTEAVTGSPSD